MRVVSSSASTRAASSEMFSGTGQSTRGADIRGAHRRAISEPGDGLDVRPELGDLVR
jgi:hypothetical protein